MIIRDNFDNSDEGSQHMVRMRDKKKYPSVFIKYCSYPEPCTYLVDANVDLLFCTLGRSATVEIPSYKIYLASGELLSSWSPPLGNLCTR